MFMPGDSDSGYAHGDYAAALGDWGVPRHLPSCGGWILLQPIKNTDLLDARGCYPIFACRDWPSLGKDLEALGQDIISLMIVADPFGNFELPELQRCFPDLCRYYKAHFVVDLSQPLDRTVSRNHARYARRAAEQVIVERCDDPARFLEDWVALYAQLVERHGITGISAFSRSSFRRQLVAPGLIAFRAIHEGETAGMVLYYVHGDVAYYHLGAYSEAGYRTRSSYAIFAHSLAYLARHVRWVNLGAGAGVQGDSSDGLSRFKRGWATDTRDAYICGRIFDRERYDALVRSRDVADSEFFPLYRSKE